MTKKHFEAFARLFAAQVATADPETHAVLRLLAVEMAGIMASDNRAFDRVRFMMACGF
jgi:hypothetical protein